MALKDRIREARKAKNLSQAALGNLIGVAKTTVAGYEKNREPTAPVIGSIADALGVDANFLLQDEFDAYKENNASLQEMKIIKKYRNLDDYGKQAVDAVLNVENERCELKPDQIEPEQPKTKIIPLFGNSFAAGTPEPDFGNFWGDYEVPIDSPAEFAIKINGKSMEPYLMDDSIALGVKRMPHIGEVAAIRIDGGYVCKQYCDDGVGNIYLFSLNRDYPDIVLYGTGNQTVEGVGTILIDKKLPPLPKTINA